MFNVLIQARQRGTPILKEIWNGRMQYRESRGEAMNIYDSTQKKTYQSTRGAGRIKTLGDDNRKRMCSRKGYCR